MPSIIVIAKHPSWSSILAYDPSADVELLEEFLRDLPSEIQTTPLFLDNAVKWQNAIRVLPPRLFVTDDFESTFPLVAEAEILLNIQKDTITQIRMISVNTSAKPMPC